MALELGVVILPGWSVPLLVLGVKQVLQRRRIGAKPIVELGPQLRPVRDPCPVGWESAVL